MSDWISLVDDLPQKDPCYKFCSVDVELLTEDGRVVPGMIFDEGDEVISYEYTGHNYRKVEATAWRTPEKEGDAL